MTYCEFCGDQISYLPFTCKFCGGTYCKKHRLPENHDCTFELKHVPVAPATQKEPRRQYKEAIPKKLTSKVYLDKGPRTLKKYLRRQEKQRVKSLKQLRGYSDTARRYQGTDIIFLLLISLTVMAMIFVYFGLGEWMYLSLNALATKFTFHTLFTSIFIDRINPYDPFFFFALFFVFIMLYFTYKITKLIEMANGMKFVIKLFLFSGFFAIIFYFLLRVALISYYPIYINSFRDSVGLLWGGIYGLISFIIFPTIDREKSALLAFVRVRMTGKAFLYMIILIRLLFGLIYGLTYDLLFFLVYLPELGGILGSYLVYKYKIFIG